MHAERTRAGAVLRRGAGDRGRAIVIAGPPASGKTTLGAALARALHHAFIDLDTVTAAMTRAALALAGADETALDSALGERLRDARYDAVLDTAAANLDVGLGVVLSGPFTRERTDGARWAAVRERLGCPEAALICLQLDEPARRRRMQARDAPRDRAKLSRPAPGPPGTLSRPAPGPPGTLSRPAPAAPGTRPPLPPGAIRLDGGAEPGALLEAALTALASPDAAPLARPDAGSFPRPEPEQPSPQRPC